MFSSIFLKVSSVHHIILAKVSGAHHEDGQPRGAQNYTSPVHSGSVIFRLSNCANNTAHPVHELERHTAAICEAPPGNYIICVLRHISACVIALISLARISFFSHCRRRLQSARIYFIFRISDLGIDHSGFKQGLVFSGYRSCISTSHFAICFALTIRWTQFSHVYHRINWFFISSCWRLLCTCPRFYCCKTLTYMCVYRSTL